MCYVRKTKAEIAAHPRPSMTKENFLRIAREARDEGMLYLLLTGGEPFLWRDFRALYEALAGMGFVLSINTNGSLIDEETVSWLKQNAPSRINITLYGASDETYRALCGADHVFERVDRAVKLLCDAGIPVKINCSLTPHNVHDAPKIIEYAKERDLICVVNTYMFPPVRRDSAMTGQNDRFSPEEAARQQIEVCRYQYGEDGCREFLESIRNGTIAPPGLDESCVDPIDGHIRCRAGNASFWVTWDGLVTPCGMMPAPAVEVRDRPFSEVWREIREKSAALKLSRVCTDCPDWELCHACAAMAIAETGTPGGIPHYLCETVAALRREADRQRT
ncbi:MAG: radical SAM protein [Clostridia bacterium]|nr:radical SAM protein [Clostridia bacterium]